MDVREIPVSEIHEDEEFNCRGVITPFDVVDLSRDIELNGLQMPVGVYMYTQEERLKTGYQYKLIQGYRRFKACTLILAWDKIPCSVQPHMTDIQARIVNLGENLNRQALNIMQEARAISALKSAGLSEADVAKQLHTSRGWIQVRFMLLDLPKEIQDEASAGLLSQQQIRDLYSIPSNSARYEQVKQIKEAKARGEKIKVKKPPNKNMLLRKERRAPEVFDFMDHVRNTIGNGFATRCLAWCAGEISDLDIHKDLKAEAAKIGKIYEIPNQPPSQVLSAM